MDFFKCHAIFDHVLVLTLTYHPFIKNFQNVLNEAHILLTPNKDHRKDFRDKPPMIGGHVSKQRTLSAKIKCEPSLVGFIDETKNF